MSYSRDSPSTNNSSCSNRHWVAFQRDGLYTGAEGEGREHLKYNVRCSRISSSAIFEEMFVNLWFSSVLFTPDFYFLLYSLNYKIRYSVCFLYLVNRKWVFWIWMALAIYLFLWRAIFIHGHEFTVMFFFGLKRVLSQDIAEPLKYVKYVTGSLSTQNLWAKHCW